MDSTVIFIDQNIPYLAEALADFGRIICFDGRTLTSNDLQREHCSVLFVRSVTHVSPALLQDTDVRFVGTATAGTDHIDIDYLLSAGIYFVSAAGSNANAVAEYTLFAMLEWAKRTNSSLCGKQVGVLGFGNVGKRVANYCNSLGMNVLVNDPPLYDSRFIFPKWVSYSSFENMCSQSDVLTNHVPLKSQGNYATLGLLSSDELRQVQKEALIIHTSRGGIIDEEALLQHIEIKQFSLVIDVWENEPLINTQLAHKAMIATPHIAGYSWNAKFLGARMMAKQFAQFYACTVSISVNEKTPQFISEQCTDEITIYNTLLQRRQFLNDSQLFKQTLYLPDIERASAFDHLRKQYPQRFESLIL